MELELDSSTLDSIYFREKGLLDTFDKPRLGFSKAYFTKKAKSGDEYHAELIRYFNYWRFFDEYILMERKLFKEGLGGGVIEQHDIIATKAVKRGNDVYFWKIKKKLKSFRDSLIKNKKFFFDHHSNHKNVNVALFTLTFDSKLCTEREAWWGQRYRKEGKVIGTEKSIKSWDEKANKYIIMMKEVRKITWTHKKGCLCISCSFNRWITNMRRKFGKISYIRVWEAFESGYPHIHALLIFHDTKFTAFRHKNKWRIREKAQFESSYHSFIDVFTEINFKRCFNYVLKYLSKSFYESEQIKDNPVKSNKKILTLAQCWLYQKQSYAISGDLITDMSNSNDLLDEMEEELDSRVIDIEYTFLGIFTPEEFDYSGEKWTVTLTKEQESRLDDTIRDRSQRR